MSVITFCVFSCDVCRVVVWCTFPKQYIEYILSNFWSRTTQETPTKLISLLITPLSLAPSHPKPLIGIAYIASCISLSFIVSKVSKTIYYGLVNYFIAPNCSDALMQHSKWNTFTYIAPMSSNYRYCGLFSWISFEDVGLFCDSDKGLNENDSHPTISIIEWNAPYKLNRLIHRSPPRRLRKSSILIPIFSSASSKHSLPLNRCCVNLSLNHLQK